MSLSINKLKNLLLKRESNRSTSIAREPIEDLSKDLLDEVSGAGRWVRWIRWIRWIRYA